MTDKDKQARQRKRVTKHNQTRPKRRGINMWFDKIITKGKYPTFTKKELKLTDEKKEELIAKLKADKTKAELVLAARHTKNILKHHRTLKPEEKRTRKAKEDATK
jgi:hypothetical protein